MYRCLVVLSIAGCASSKPAPSNPEPAPEAEPAAAPAPAPAIDLSGEPDEVLQRAAEIEAPGMQPYAGSLRKLSPGQPTEIEFQVKSGRCYTIVAFAPDVTSLGARLQFQNGPLPPMVVATSTRSDRLAIVGAASAGGCWQDSLPGDANATLSLTATGGEGTAFYQVLVK